MWIILRRLEVSISSETHWSNKCPYATDSGRFWDTLLAYTCCGSKLNSDVVRCAFSVWEVYGHHTCQLLTALFFSFLAEHCARLFFFFHLHHSTDLRDHLEGVQAGSRHLKVPVTYQCVSFAYCLSSISSLMRPVTTSLYFSPLLTVRRCADDDMLTLLVPSPLVEVLSFWKKNRKEGGIKKIKFD